MDHPTDKDVNNCPSAVSQTGPSSPSPPPPPPPTSTFVPYVIGSTINRNGSIVVRHSSRSKGSILPLPTTITTSPSNGTTNGSAVPLDISEISGPGVAVITAKRPFVDVEDDNRSALKEMFLPVMLSGFGNMGAGMVLERVQFMDIFMAIPQLIQLVPPLLGLKGNVEMTLASRLSTHANLGHLSDMRTRRRIIIGNIALCQFLATGVGFIAPCIALLLSHFSITGHSEVSPLVHQPPAVTANDGHLSASSLLDSTATGITSSASMVTFDIDHTNDFGSPAITKSLLVVAIFLATSGLADVILSSVITGVVIVSSQILGINADNVATPIAASVGDLMTMCFLVFVSKGLYNATMRVAWAPLVPLIIWTVIVIFTGIVARRNPFTRSKVFHGWSPLVVSMLLQNISGIVMETSLRRFPRMAIYQPIINGFGGNLVAIQSSRVATYFQKHAPKRELVNESDACCHSPLLFFCGQGQHGKLAFLMVLLAGPIQLPLVLISTFLSPTSEITIAQLLTYYVCATLQVIIILYIGYCFVNLLWLFGANPDDNAIPILTALADLLGTIILVAGYMFLASIGDKNATTLNDQNLPKSSIVYNATNTLITSLNNNNLTNPLVNYSKLYHNNTQQLSPFSMSTTTLSTTLIETINSSLLTTPIPTTTTTTLPIVTSILSTTLAPLTTTTISKLTSTLIANLTSSPSTPSSLASSVVPLIKANQSTF